MTRKPRRKKPVSKSEAKTAETPTAETAADLDSTPTDDSSTRDAAVDEPPAATAAKASKLPAFGFAADLLASRSEESDGGSASPSAADTPATDSEPLAERQTPEADDPGADPERIFHFADSLELEEEEETVAQRLTTWITFSLEGETFALPVEPVREVLRLSHITRVPHAPRPIRGVTNLRGRVIPVIDLRVRIELPAGGIDRSTRVIVVGSRGRLIGLMVDAVHQVVHIDLNRVQPPPDDVMTVQSDYLAGVYQHEERLILLLDVDRALILRDAPAENLGQGAA